MSNSNYMTIIICRILQKLVSSPFRGPLKKCNPLKKQNMSNFNMVLIYTCFFLSSTARRGALGPLTVWVTKRDDNDHDHAETGTVQRRSNSQRSMRYNLRNHHLGHGANVRRGEMVMKEQYWEKVYDRAHR